MIRAISPALRKEKTIGHVNNILDAVADYIIKEADFNLLIPIIQ